jgi:hypothetical protein
MPCCLLLPSSYWPKAQNLPSTPAPGVSGLLWCPVRGLLMVGRRDNGIR